MRALVLQVTHFGNVGEADGTRGVKVILPISDTLTDAEVADYAVTRGMVFLRQALEAEAERKPRDRTKGFATKKRRKRKESK